MQCKIKTITIQPYGNTVKPQDMKTLQEIIERKDYVRVTERLADAVVELAEKIRNKMQSLDLDNWDDVTIGQVKSYNSGYSNSYLAFNDGCSLYDLETRQNGYYYYCNDFNAKVLCASNKMRLDFLNNANEILQELDKYETEQTKEIEDALVKAGY